MNFVKLNNLPVYDLLSELERLISENKIWWHQVADQICLNSTLDDPDNFHLGRGSLLWDWDSFVQGSENANMVKKRDKILQESDFVNLCSGFKDSLFEEVYTQLEKQYVLGRVRIMKSLPKTCLTWHVDHTPRIHYPMKTQEGCMMIIEDEVMHLPLNTWWRTNTTVNHTAINASRDYRLHLVVAVLGER